MQTNLEEPPKQFKPRNVGGEGGGEKETLIRQTKPSFLGKRRTLSSIFCGLIARVGRHLMEREAKLFLCISHFPGLLITGK